VRIDHVVMAVRDLDAAADRLLRRHGLASMPGGRHPAWGTANRIAPLGDAYVELLGVVDHEVGASTWLGRALLDRSAGGARWFAVCLADDGIEATAARLGLDVAPGSRTRPDGTVLSWRGAGIESPAREGWLPFFIDWDGPPELHPGRASVEHPAAPTGIARVELTGDPEALRRWVGGDLPELAARPGERRGVDAVVLSTSGGGELRIA